jgi:PAS domain-containing protein
MQTLRDQTQQVSFARFEAERRLRNLKRYANLFTSAADGPRRRRCQRPRPLREPSRVRDRRHRRERGARQARSWPSSIRATASRRCACGRASSAATTRTASICGSRERSRGRKAETYVFSCSFSPLQETDGAVLFSFRDVTTERTIALELAKTKDFLESIIRASVDAIIAASATGEILLFNPGAERITGWKASEVVGKKSVTVLYPDEGARAR